MFSSCPRDHLPVQVLSEFLNLGRPIDIRIAILDIVSF